ncbi:unnamed protein product, partial [Ectocarpus sp. 12 AP-2014]
MANRDRRWYVLPPSAITPGGGVGKHRPCPRGIRPLASRRRTHPLQLLREATKKERTVARTPVQTHMRAPGARFWRAVERFWAKIREEASGEGQDQTFFGSSIAAVGAEDCRGGYEEQQAVVRAEAKARKEREIAEAEREKTASTTPGVRSRRRVKM